MANKIAPCLWFDGQAEEAANFYASVFSDSSGISDSVRNPCAIVPPNGVIAAISGFTWMNWWSPVASANLSIISCVTSTQSDTASLPICVARSWIVIVDTGFPFIA